MCILILKERKSNSSRAAQNFLGGAQTFLGGAQLPQAPPLAPPLDWTSSIWRRRKHIGSDYRFLSDQP